MVTTYPSVQGQQVESTASECHLDWHRQRILIPRIGGRCSNPMLSSFGFPLNHSIENHIWSLYKSPFDGLMLSPYVFSHFFPWINPLVHWYRSFLRPIQVPSLTMKLCGHQRRSTSRGTVPRPFGGTTHWGWRSRKQTWKHVDTLKMDDISFWTAWKLDINKNLQCQAFWEKIVTLLPEGIIW